MQQLSGFRYGELVLDRDAGVLDRTGLDEVAAAAGDLDDVIVVAHGWNNDMAEARLLYRRLAEQLRPQVDALPDGRRIALLGVLWPSKRFADSSLIAGGAASAASTAADTALATEWAQLRQAADGAGPAELAHDPVPALIQQLDDSQQARDAFVNAVRALLPAGTGDDAEDRPAQLDTLPGREVLARLAPPVLPPAGPATGGDPRGSASGSVGASAGGAVTGSASGFGLFTGGPKAAAQRLLNLTTYYLMKDRAGLVGTVVGTLLAPVRQQHEALGIHLVGHSFGGRLVTAAAAGVPGRPGLRPDSLVLLQAAFSHHGFAAAYDGDRDGSFRRVVTGALVRGPILITHSVDDLAVGLAYPLASRLARQQASGLGDEHDRYGGIGRNGAQRTPEARAETLLPVDGQYRFAAGVVHNLRADGTIADHGDVTGPEVAHAIVAAVSARVAA